MQTILLVDPETDFLEWAQNQLETPITRVVTSTTADEAYKIYIAENPDLLISETHLMPFSGLELLARVRQRDSNALVILMSAFGTTQSVIESMKLGAFDYLRKESLPFNLKPVVDAALTAQAEMRSATAFKPQLTVEQYQDSLVGKSQPMQQVFKMIGRVSHSDAPVMITGESGSGKELVARAIHHYSNRSIQPFIAINCAAIPENLLESELFGHEKGAFTGADKPRIGLIKQADGGTLFLDEVGDLPLIMQKAFLRVLQERRFRPLGARQEVESNFRLLAATNRDLDQAVAEGTFRKDLLFRLRSLSLTLPPLRDHLEDIKDLVLFHTDKLCESYGIPQKGFAPEFFECLLAFRWPGNVRELINTLDRAIAEARHEPTLYPNHLPGHIRIQAARNTVIREIPGLSPASAASAGVNLPKLRDYREAAVAQAERDYLKELMVRAKNDLLEACRISDLSQPRLYALLKKHRVSRSKGARTERDQD